MAYEADRVVVELIAKTDGFDQTVKQSATKFDSAVGNIGKSAAAVEVVLNNLKRKMSDALSAGDSAKASGFASQIAKIEGALGTLAVSSDKVTKSSGNARVAQLEFGHAVRGAADQLAAGAPPMQVFATHLGQVTQAAGFAGGSLGAVGRFLAGPWGLAVTIGGVALAQIIGKFISAQNEVGELVDKLKEHARQTALSEEADRIWSRTLDGLIDRQRRLNEELGKRLVVQAAVDKADVAQAQKDAVSLARSLADERQRLKDLQAQLAGAQRDPNLGTNVGGAAEARVQQLKSQVAASIDQIKRLEGAITDAQQRITKGQIVVGEAQGQAMADLTARAQRWAELQQNILRTIEQRQGGKLAGNATQLSEAFYTLKKSVDDAASAGVNFDATTKRTDALNVQLNAGKISVRTYTTEVTKLAVALEQAAEAAKEAKKGTGEFGSQVSFAEARKIAEGAGLTVTSAFRSTAKQAALYNDPNVNKPGNPVAKPGTSAHEGVRGRWALDIAFAPGLTAGKVKKVFGDQGVALSLVKKESGHFHIEGSTSKADASQREADQAAAKALRDDQAFANEKASIQDQIIAARQALLTSSEAIAQLELDSIDLAHDKYADQVAYNEKAGHLQEDEAATLLKLNDERRDLLKEAVRRRENERKFRLQEEAFQNAAAYQQGGADAEQELLQSQVGLARTSKQRLEIEQRLIDLQFYEEKLKNQYIIDWAARVAANKDATDKEKADAALAGQIAQMHQDTLDERHDNATAGNSKSNANSLQSYLDSIPQGAQEIDEALMGVAAHGLQAFTDGIVDALVHFKSLGDVARSVLSEITAMLIRMVVQQLILKALGGLAGGGPVGASTTGTGQAIGGRVGHFAPGGSIFGAGGPTSDSIPIWASNGEYMIKTKSAKALGYGTLDYINRTGELPPHLADGGMVRRINPMNTPAAAGGGRGGFSSSDIRVLRGIVAEAAAAVPDVSLYASLDPADVLQRALGTPAGHRALIAHLGSNSSAVKGALNRP